MESTINRLIVDYESGKLSRRQLVRSLAAAAAAMALPRRAAAQPLVAPVENPFANGFRTVGIDHISFSVKDYEKTRDFYADLMGWRAEAYADGSKQVRLFWGPASLPGLSGGSHTIARNADFSKTPAGQPTASVGHISYQIADWDTDKVEAELKRRGLDPRLDTGTEGRRPWASFHVKDPNGYDLQISGDVKPGDRLHKG
jgi:catechol 2,3-dioxygenase-like lactoylglutathione lyase family enzyme